MIREDLGDYTEKELVSVLLEARDAYYKKGEPIMPDAEYDALERELAGRVKANPALAATAEPVLGHVGSDLTASGRIRHSRPMLSIENQYDKADVQAWCAKLPAGAAVCLEPKFDGVSVELRYRNRRLVQAVSRGPGTEGEDCTAQATAIADIPKSLPPELPATLDVRGELVMRTSTLERLNAAAEKVGGKIYQSTRNLTAGTMKQRDLSTVADREIQIMPWDVWGDGLPDSGVERLKLIQKAGFQPPLGSLTTASSPDDVLAALDLKLADRERVMKGVLHLETDGVVIKVDSNALRQRLGVASKYTNWQTCFKPQSASGTTYLRKIEWQVGRTGRISPVAVCDPVVLASARVTNASLNNITWIRNMGLKLGAKVEMLRSGDVIPQIVRVIDEGDEEIAPPTACPECGGPVTESDEGGTGILQQFCVNAQCPAVLAKNLEFVGGREVLEIDGLGLEMAKRLVETDFARNIAELYEFANEAAAAASASATRSSCATCATSPASTRACSRCSTRWRRPRPPRGSGG